MYTSCAASKLLVIIYRYGDPDLLPGDSGALSFIEERIFEPNCHGLSNEPEIPIMSSYDAADL